MSWYLVAYQGPLKGKAFPLESNEITIGRAGDNQIIINDPQVSRHHARLTAQGGSYVIEDVESANGTWINTNPWTYPVMLQSHDSLQLGDNVILVYSDSPQITIEPKKVEPGEYKVAEQKMRSAPQQRGRAATRALPVYFWGAVVGIAILAAITLGISVASRGTPTPLPPSPIDASLKSAPTAVPMMKIEAPIAPTATPAAKPAARPFEIAIMARRYEPWGWPEHPGGCAGPYDENNVQERFIVKLVLTNNSFQSLRGDWKPKFRTDIGTDVPACMAEFDDTSIPPGATKEATFFTHILADKWIAQITVREADYEWVACLDENGGQVECSPGGIRY